MPLSDETMNQLRKWADRNNSLLNQKSISYRKYSNNTIKLGVWEAMQRDLSDLVAKIDHLNKELEQELGESNVV